MINEELDAPFTDDGSSLGGDVDNYTTELDYDEEDEFVRYRKEMIFSETDFTKSKTKVGCTLG